MIENPTVRRKTETQNTTKQLTFIEVAQYLIDAHNAEIDNGKVVYYLHITKNGELVDEHKADRSFIEVIGYNAVFFYTGWDLDKEDYYNEDEVLKKFEDVLNGDFVRIAYELRDKANEWLRTTFH